MKKDQVNNNQEKRISVKARYSQLEAIRYPILQRARECAELTIPYLLPPEGFNETFKLKTPYQGLGAMGVNNLASKMLLALLPPNSPFFRYSIDDFTLEKLAGNEDLRSQVEEALNKVERAIMSEIEVTAIRIPMFEALKLLIVTGNTLLYLPDEGGMKTFKLDSYVIKRDPMGNVIEIIIKERVHPITLPEEFQDVIKAKLENPDEKVDIYTHIKRTKDKWIVKQEVGEEIVPGTEGTYPLDNSPWIPLRWIAISGEDYGRGFVEEYIGDLTSLEGLSKAIVEFAAAASRVIPLVNPNGTTKIKDLAQARNGDFVRGNAQDVTFLQMEKYADFKVVAETATKIEQRLAQSFLLMTSIQRDAERVTAEEIRAMVKELEDSLGGVYSVLAQELQMPLLKRLQTRMEKQKRLPKIPKNIKPMITVGLEALGRGNDLNKLDMFVTEVQKLGPAAEARLKMGNVITRIGTSLAIDTKDLIISDEEFAQQQNLAQLAQFVQNAGPKVAQEITKGVMANNAPTEETGQPAG